MRTAGAAGQQGPGSSRLQGPWKSVLQTCSSIVRERLVSNMQRLWEADQAVLKQQVKACWVAGRLHKAAAGCTLVELYVV
jgi:hypothetical protein